MRYLLATRDKRLLDALCLAAPADAVIQVPDVAAALRLPPADAVALDAALPPATLDDFVRVWRDLPAAPRLVAVEPGAERVPALPRAARDPAAILDALRARPPLRFLAREAILARGETRVSLTPTEALLLAALVRAASPLSARELQEAAFGYPGDGAAVRTHVANLRRKCRRAGLGLVIVTEARRYRAPGLRAEDELRTRT